MGVYSIVSNDQSVGTTIGTFDPINSRNPTVELRAGTTGVVGVSVCMVRDVQTTGTAILGRLRIASADLNLAEGSADFHLGQAHGAGVASNSMPAGSIAEWLPLEIAARPNNTLTHAYSATGIEPADNVAIQVGTAHMTSAPPAVWFEASMAHATIPATGSVSSNGGSTTTARTSLTSVRIPARFGKLIGLRAVGIMDPATTSAEAMSSFVDITSTIGDFSPQEWPTNGVGASLGTVVGGGAHIDQPHLPFYFEKGTSGTETIEPFVTGLDTLSGAAAYGYGMLLRE